MSSAEQQKRAKDQGKSSEAKSDTTNVSKQKDVHYLASEGYPVDALVTKKHYEDQTDDRGVGEKIREGYETAKVKVGDAAHVTSEKIQQGYEKTKQVVGDAAHAVKEKAKDLVGSGDTDTQHLQDDESAQLESGQRFTNNNDSDGHSRMTSDDQDARPISTSSVDRREKAPDLVGSGDEERSKWSDKLQGGYGGSGSSFGKENQQSVGVKTTQGDTLARIRAGADPLTTGNTQAKAARPT